jgi:DNA-binding MarR family transcriptional regulator
MPEQADISLLFDLFVTTQKVRRMLTHAMAEAGMRPDEYAVYSLLLERAPLTATEMAEQLGMPLTTVLDYLSTMTAMGHLRRQAHPGDGRAVQLRLSSPGAAAHRRANRHWEVARERIESRLSMPIERVRLALAALGHAADELEPEVSRPRSRR